MSSPAATVADLKRRLGALKRRSCFHHHQPTIEGALRALLDHATDEALVVGRVAEIGRLVSQLERMADNCGGRTIYYLVDCSSSVEHIQDDGEGEFRSLLEMIKLSIQAANATLPDDIEVALVSYSGGFGTSCTPSVGAFVTLWNLPSTPEEVDFYLDSLSPLGNGPMAHGIRLLLDWISQSATIILISDGGPNMSDYGPASDAPPEDIFEPAVDLLRIGEGTVLDEVEALTTIDISDGAGGWRTPEDVEGEGSSCSDEQSGALLAAVMRAAQGAALAGVTIKPVIIKADDTDYSPQILDYVADVTGGGAAVTALTLAELIDAVTAAVA